MAPALLKGQVSRLMHRDGQGAQWSKEGPMKAIVGGAIGAAALGGALLLANTRSTASSPATTVASTSALPQVGPLAVDCGTGRIALLKPVTPGQQYSQVECAPAANVVEPQAFAQPQGSYL